jgi:hypothetical protein
VGNFHSSGFTATTGFDLGLDNDGSANFGSCRFGLFRGIRY